MPLTELLTSLPAQEGKNSLAHLLSVSGLKLTSYKKSMVVYALNQYLSDKHNIVEIWEKITPYEKEIIAEYLRSNGKPHDYDVREICEKHKRTFKKNFEKDFTELFNARSKARLFFINRSIHHSIKNVLNKFVKPMERVFTPVEESELEIAEFGEIIVAIGESFERDFIGILRLINNSNLKIVNRSYLPNKAAFVKINAAMVNKECFLVDDIQEYSNIEATARVFGTVLLMWAADIVDIESGIMVLGEKATTFLELSLVEKCNYLLKSYLSSDYINELSRIAEIDLQTINRGDFTSCRKLILDYLACCPVGKWISMLELQNMIRRQNRNYLTSQTGEIGVYNNMYAAYIKRNDNWQEIEGRYIDVVFYEYLVAMGIVDIVARLTDDYNTYDEVATVRYFRLTELGAYVLGVIEEYSYNDFNEETGFIVQPNFEIIIGKGRSEALYSLFFDRFAEKVTQDMVNIYRLSFKSMVTAIDKGIAIREIIDYLVQHCSHEVPENVMLTLQNWLTASQKIRIRTVTILETDSDFLLQELMSYKTINKYVVKELPYVCEVDENSLTKLKREIEKKNHFCLKE